MWQTTSGPRVKGFFVLQLPCQQACRLCVLCTACGRERAALVMPVPVRVVYNYRRHNAAIKGVIGASLISASKHQQQLPAESGPAHAAPPVDASAASAPFGAAATAAEPAPIATVSGGAAATAAVRSRPVGPSGGALDMYPGAAAGRGGGGAAAAATAGAVGGSSSAFDTVAYWLKYSSLGDLASDAAGGDSLGSFYQVSCPRVRVRVLVRVRARVCMCVRVRVRVFWVCVRLGASWL